MMIRNLKVLGLCLVALFAMSAMTASLAAAATPDFDVETSAAEPVTITGTQKTTHTFELTDRTVVCEVVAFEGTTNNPTPNSIKMAAFYDKCKTTEPVLTATITGFATDHNDIGKEGKCWYRLDASGAAALECNKGEVTIDAGTCTIHIPPQEFQNAVTYSTETLSGGKHDLTVSFDVNGVKATHTDGFLCPFNGSGTGETANFHGTSTAFAELESNGDLRHLTHTP